MKTGLPSGEKCQPQQGFVTNGGESREVSIPTASVTKASITTSITTRAWLEINPSALGHNIQQIKSLLSPTTELMAVVKANAYGHGAVLVAQTALKHGVTSLAVATIAEGQELRRAGIEAPILVLGAVNTPDEVWAIVQYHLEPNLSTPEQAKLFSATITNSEKTVGWAMPTLFRNNSGLAQNKVISTMRWAMPTLLKNNSGTSLPVHVNIDTGMSRLGMPWQKAQELVQLVQSLPGLELASIYSHLATAEDQDSLVRQQQHDRFQQVVDRCQALGLPAHVKFHLANSAGTLVDSGLHYDRVRVGLSLYGLYPAPHFQSLISLQPVMAIKARITLVKHLTAGTGVSYGHRFTAPRDMLLAVVGIGYADGVPRLLSNKMKVLVRGQFVPQIGSITMDQLMLDVSSTPDLQPGEVVTLLGQDGDRTITADDWAEAIETISWEILCGFKSRLPHLISEQ